MTRIDAAKFEAILSTKSGLTITPQSAFVKISAAKGRNVYVELKPTVGRVDVSGFSLDLPGLVKPSKANGAVEQQIDFRLTEDEVLEVFEAVIDHMLTLGERTIVRGARSSNASNAVGWSFSKATEAPSA